MLVASYCRVSTDKENQLHSFTAQQQYFTNYIQHQPDWELYRIYADEGITGTSTKKRVQFQQMMEDAYAGKFQLIVTKEVSRFSRNILDTIAYTRALKKLGIGVLFVNDHIDTLQPDAELRLSIMGSIAQEESRKTSERVKWGQTRQMEQGVVFGRSLLGYDVKNGIISVNPEGAKIVRLIFHQYGIEKKGTSVIARTLQRMGICTYTGNTQWNSSHIIKILKNEKYVGDLVQKKTYTPDYLTHEKKYNHGEQPLIVIHNHHEPIIDRNLWDTVQQQLKKRNVHHGTGHSNRYICSGKIKCGQCGASFVSRKKYRKDGSFIRYWNCFHAVNKGINGCDIGIGLRDDVAIDMIKQCLQTIKIDWEQLSNHVTALAMDAMGQKNLDKQEYCELRASVKNKITEIVSGEMHSEIFYKRMLYNMTVYKDKRVQVALQFLQQKWIFYVK